MSAKSGRRPSAALLAALIATGATAAAAQSGTLSDGRGDALAAEPLRLQLAPTLGHTEISLARARETLSNNPNDWTDTQLELLHQFAPRKLLIARATGSERFGLHDDTLSLSGYYPAGERTTIFAELSSSATHRVLPRDSMHLQLAQALAQGWGLIGGLRHVSYNSTKVDIADLTLERYFADYRVALTVYPSHSQLAGSATSYRLQFSRYYGEDSNIQLAIVRGTEVDKPTDIDTVIASSVRSLALFGRHRLTRNWALGYGVGHTVQGASTRHAANVDLRYRF